MTRQARHSGLQRALPDARSRTVVFLAHCLLNQNTRYLGGAVCPGAVPGAIDDYVDRGVGIVQLPCPEQQVWGGVLKTRMLWVLEHPRAARAGPLAAHLAVVYLRYRYRRLARAIVTEVEDNIAAGFTPVAIVGVAGSPSCGAGTTLSLPVALAAIGRCPKASLTTRWMKDAVITPALRPGSGLFTEALRHELRRRRLDVPLREYALADEPLPVGSSRPPPLV